MSPKPILYETHMHTPLCKHARGEPEEYAAVAEEQGLAGVVVTCHNPPVDGWSPHVRMATDEFDTYVTMVHRAQRAWSGRIDVRLGLECDYVPGMEGAIERQLSWADFDYVLGSVHPDLAEYQARYAADDIVRFQQTYYEHLAMAAETGLFDTLSHPDLVKNYRPEAWDPHRIRDAIESALDRIARTGVAMELNTSGLHKRVREMNPGQMILSEMNRRGIPVVVGADAHVPQRVGADFDRALKLVEEAGYHEVSYFVGRQRRIIDVTAALHSVQPVAV